MLKLIVGLGNPGQRYIDHRHNYGFRWLDALAERAGLRWSERFGGALAGWDHQAGKIWLLKPLEMMNASGAAVGKVARYYDIAPQEILVAYDELALPLGKIRIKQGGGSNGHNGVKDIVRHIGADFHRLRLGIDHPGAKHLVHNHVLSNFRAEERRIVTDVVDDACRYADFLLTERFADFMTRLAIHAPSGEIS